MGMFILLASKGAGDYLDFIADKTNNIEHVHEDGEGDGSKLEAHTGNRVTIIFATLMVLVLWIRFAVIECRQIKESPFIYLTDVWNVFDMISLILNAIFIVMVNAITFSAHLAFDPVTIRTIGSLAAWFLWIKVFYWMRLFQDTAYFITLIR